MSPRIAIVAGEASGDWLGARLIDALRARIPTVECLGMAGPAMIAAGCTPCAHIDELSVMGLTEVLRSYPRLRRLQGGLVQRLGDARPDVFVGIDVPDFNTGIERALRARGVPIVHYVCPQAWAWRPGRARGLATLVDELLALLPFEPAFFAAHGVRCTYVGHPLADVLPLVPDRAAARAALGLEPSAPLVAVLPGSRGHELERLLPAFAAGFAALARARPALRGAVCVARPAQVDLAARILAAAGVGGRLPVLHGRARELLTAADVALVASGTVTLEALLCRTPMVVGYRLAALSYHIIRRMIAIPRIALPNILADDALVPELIQDALTPAAIERELAAWLDDDGRRRAFGERADALHRALAGDGAGRAADAVLAWCGRR